jgi:hypothetical protein
MAYLVKPVREADVQAAVHVALARFRQYLEVRREVDSLRQALEERKLVERAKGAVMKRLGVGEEEAFRRLRGFVRSRNRRLAGKKGRMGWQNPIPVAPIPGRPEAVGYRPTPSEHMKPHPAQAEGPECASPPTISSAW